MIPVLTTTLLNIKVNDKSLSTGVNYLTFLPKIGGCKLIKIHDADESYPKNGAIVTIQTLNTGKNLDIFYGLDVEFLRY